MIQLLKKGVLKDIQFLLFLLLLWHQFAVGSKSKKPTFQDGVRKLNRTKVQKMFRLDSTLRSSRNKDDSKLPPLGKEYEAWDVYSKIKTSRPTEDDTKSMFSKTVRSLNQSSLRKPPKSGDRVEHFKSIIPITDSVHKTRVSISKRKHEETEKQEGVKEKKNSNIKEDKDEVKHAKMDKHKTLLEINQAPTRSALGYVKKSESQSKFAKPVKAGDQTSLSNHQNKKHSKPNQTQKPHSAVFMSTQPKLSTQMKDEIKKTAKNIHSANGSFKSVASTHNTKDSKSERFLTRLDFIRNTAHPKHKASTQNPREKTMSKDLTGRYSVKPIIPRVAVGDPKPKNNQTLPNRSIKTTNHKGKGYTHSPQKETSVKGSRAYFDVKPTTPKNLIGSTKIGRNQEFDSIIKTAPPKRIASIQDAALQETVTKDVRASGTIKPLTSYAQIKSTMRNKQQDSIFIISKATMQPRHESSAQAKTHDSITKDSSSTKQIKFTTPKTTKHVTIGSDLSKHGLTQTMTNPIPKGIGKHPTVASMATESNQGELIKPSRKSDGIKPTISNLEKLKAFFGSIHGKGAETPEFIQDPVSNSNIFSRRNKMKSPTPGTVVLRTNSSGSITNIKSKLWNEILKIHYGQPKPGSKKNKSVPEDDKDLKLSDVNDFWSNFNPTRLTVQVCQEEGWCARDCRKDSSEECYQDCLSGKCNLTCAGKKLCQQHCIGNVLCRNVRSSASEECIQKCTAPALCDTLYCYNCKKCKQTFENAPGRELAGLQASICAFDVPFCEITAYRSTVFAFVGADVNNVTSVDSYIIMRITHTSIVLNVNCTGKTAVCLVSYDPRHNIDVKDVCRKNCGSIKMEPAVMNKDGYEVELGEDWPVKNPKVENSKSSAFQFSQAQHRYKILCLAVFTTFFYTMLPLAL